MPPLLPGGGAEQPAATIVRVGPYRSIFYSGDRDEPRHVHVDRDANRAKFWLEPVRLHDSTGFRGAELARLAAIVATHRLQLVRAWDEFFGS